jgi:hypothetical protein
MAYVTIEDRVDRLEALFGQFMTEMALLNKKSEERHKAAEERHKAAEERHVAAEQRFARFEKEMAEFKNEMAQFKNEMRASKRELDKKWGDLANKMGTIIEDILAPNLLRLARDHFQFPVIEQSMIRCTRRAGAVESEFDTLVIGPEAVVLGEAKSTPSNGYADDFAAKVSTFFDYFPELKGRRLIPIFGSWSIPDSVVYRLTTLGIYAMRMGEDTMELANADTLEGR